MRRRWYRSYWNLLLARRRRRVPGELLTLAPPDAFAPDRRHGERRALRVGVLRYGWRGHARVRDSELDRWQRAAYERHMAENA